MYPKAFTLLRKLWGFHLDQSVDLIVMNSFRSNKLVPFFAQAILFLTGFWKYHPCTHHASLLSTGFIAHIVATLEFRLLCLVSKESSYLSNGRSPCWPEASWSYSSSGSGAQEDGPFYPALVHCNCCVARWWHCDMGVTGPLMRSPTHCCSPHHPPEEGLWGAGWSRLPGDAKAQLSLNLEPFQGFPRLAKGPWPDQPWTQGSFSCLAGTMEK